MIRRYATAVLGFLFSLSAFAQPYGNEWINFSTNQAYSNQQYFKVSVWRDGMYRITPGDLQAAGFPSGFNPKQLQLFYQGAEQFIHVEGEADGVFDPGDYIEFFGKRNDGAADTRLYKDPDHQVNKNFSLFTDTAAYFLTLNANPFVTNRRMGAETDVNFLGYTPIPYFIREAYAEYTVVYNASKIQDLADAEYDEGEGFYSSAMLNTPVNFLVPVPNVSSDPSAPLAVATSVTMGNNNTGNVHSLLLDVNGAVQSVSFSGYAINKFNITLPSNNVLLGGTANFNFTPGSGVTNRNVVAFNKVVYPHTLSYAGETGNFRKLLIPGNLAPGKSFLDLTGLLMTNPRLFMFSGDTLKRVSTTGAGTNLQALIPTFGTDKPCFLSDSIYTTSSGHMRIAPVNTDPGHFARFTNFQYISNGDYLIITHPQLLAKADDYRAYRATTGYTPLLTDVYEVYNQFGYGISQHPQSIKNFCEFALDTFLLKPQYLLLIGKSVTSTKCRFAEVNWNKNLVPTFGFPPADLLFTSGFDGDTIPRPRIAVGRISAQNDADIQAYLDKVMVHDLQLQPPYCPQDWMKQVLHFGGGNNIYQQQEIKTILEKYEKVVEDTLMAGNVISFYKTSPDPIQINQSQYLQALIDSGTTIMTFVAHASGTTFDISTDVPQNYNNKDRYPIVIANSCFVGDIHDPLRRIAEDFVLLPEKGSIGFIAEPDVGYLPNLAVYTEQLYRQIALINYGGTLGQSMLNTIDSVFADPNTMLNQYTYLFFKSVCTGMTLSGDPALVLNSFAAPEYEIKQSGVFFTPATVSSDIDSFDVSVVIKNLGRASNISSVLHMKRTFPDGSVYERDTVLGVILYRDTITFRLPVDPSRGVGPNTFEFYADYFNNISECNEGNNSPPTIPLLIQSSDIVPVYPAEFAIVPNPSIKLKASTVNPFSPVKPYKFQIDTVDTFNSPFLTSTLINSSGGVVQWQLPFSLTENLVYYWRVARDSMPADTIHPPWKESSFIHKQGLTGWSQAHYSQFKKDEFININYKNAYDTTFSFVTSFSSLIVRNYYQPNNLFNPNYEINNVVQDYQMCFAVPSMHIVVIDSLTLKPWATDQYSFGNVNTFNPATGTGTCRNRPEFYFIFRMNDAAQRDSMIDMLVNDIPNGNYVVAYTAYSGQFSQWTPAQLGVFTAMGSTAITTLNDSHVYIFFTKKGNTATTQELVGDSVNTAITLNVQLGGNWSKGYVVSVPIGPSVGWTSLHWDQDPFESVPGADSTAIDIIGIQANGLETPLAGFQGIQVGTPDLNISSIDHTVYPKLKLQAYVQDETLFTPPQLKRWQIYYDEIPELAINPNRYFKLNKDTLGEGEELRMEVAIENIGSVDADSLLTDFYLYDDDHVRHNLTSPKYKETSPGDTIIASVKFSTGGYAGLNSLWIEANPRSDQPEQYHFNNFGQIDFRVNRDITNPILDVTFDGVHILNGDIISGKPEILVRLKDENKYLALKDTTNWQVFLKNPLGVQKRLRFEPNSCSGPGTELLKWCPAALPQNTFLIQHKPVFTMDGIYELWVQATDESGNISGDNDYRITFEVINKSTITEVVNYPNPFSTSTRFVFTLTGSEIPQQMKIQIMTVTGKVVREITQDEIGPIRIGRNITEYAWNGKDEFGDQLANGVYLYRVITRLNGSSIEKRETEADKFFTKGWGKMYLMR